MKVYTTGVSDFVDSLINKGFELFTIKEGTLGWGTTVLVKDGFKSVVIQERYLNDWNSGHTVRKYNKLPKVYQTAIQ